MRNLQPCLRVYAETDQADAVIAFYEGLQQLRCERRVKIEETGVVAAKAGAVLILAGDAAHLDPVRQVDAIFYLDKLDDFRDWLEHHGAEILHGPREVTGGRNLPARHPDGLVVEYFEAG